MKLALIGCGAVAAKHAQTIAEGAAAQLHWLCDIRREAAEAISNRFAPIAKIAADFSQVPLAEVDGLVICSPTAEHHAQVSAALRAGKHVLCEKPLAANSAQIRELISFRNTTKSVLAVAFQRRTESPYVTVRKLLAERATEFGPLKTMHLFICERWSQTIEGTWRNDPRLGFGYFGDAGVHQIDSIAYVTGYVPLRVQARGDRRGRNVEIVTDIRSQWLSPDGITVAMTAQFVGDANHWREDIALHFENADLLMRSGEIQICRHNQCQILNEMYSGTTPIADFLAACRGEKATVAPAECGLVSALWTEAVLASIPNSEWIDLART